MPRIDFKFDILCDVWRTFSLKFCSFLKEQSIFNSHSTFWCFLRIEFLVFGWVDVGALCEKFFFRKFCQFLCGNSILGGVSCLTFIITLNVAGKLSFIKFFFDGKCFLRTATCKIVKRKGVRRCFRVWHESIVQ